MRDLSLHLLDIVQNSLKAGSSRIEIRIDANQAHDRLTIEVIDDGNGFRSVYAHFGKVVVKRGQSVRAGELLGYEGRTGNASGCHLHYGLFSAFERGEIAIEPSVAKWMKLPREEIARIDPDVLPDRHGDGPAVRERLQAGPEEPGAGVEGGAGGDERLLPGVSGGGSC